MCNCNSHFVPFRFFHQGDLLRSAIYVTPHNGLWRNFHDRILVSICCAISHLATVGDFYQRFGFNAIALSDWSKLQPFLESQDKPKLSYMTNGNMANNRHSQIVRRNNSSIWEKPSFSKRRVPQLEQISEDTESYSQTARSATPSRRSASPSRRSRRSRQSGRPASRQSRSSTHHSEQYSDGEPQRNSVRNSEFEVRNSVRNSMIRQSSHGPSLQEQHIEEVDEYGFEPQHEVQVRDYKVLRSNYTPRTN